MLLNAQDGHIENQCCIGRDSLVPLRAVAQGGRKNDATNAARFHSNQALIPTLNDLRLAKRGDGKGLSFAIIGAIKFITITCQPARVLYGDRTSLLRRFAAPDLEIETLESISVCGRGSCHDRRILRTCRRG